MAILDDPLDGRKRLLRVNMCERQARLHDPTDAAGQKNDLWCAFGSIFGGQGQSRLELPLLGRLLDHMCERRTIRCAPSGNEGTGGPEFAINLKCAHNSHCRWMGRQRLEPQSYVDACAATHNFARVGAVATP